MDIRDIDWGLLRSFLAVARSGSLSAAARDSGQSQPTLGRHIRALEDHVGGPLFDRHARGLTPSALGRALLPGAEAMATAASQVKLAVAGEDHRAAGPVRITASVYVSVYLLPPILTELRQTFPEIQIELVPSDRSENLLFHEADIALRMYRPEQLDMITRHVGDLSLGLFASREYLARRGEPQSLAELMDHDVIGYDRDDRILKGFRDAGLPVTREWFALRTDNQVAYWELTCAGAGIGIGQNAVAKSELRVRQILPGAPLPSLPIWLTAHEHLRHVPRIARVWEALAAGLRPLVS